MGGKNSGKLIDMKIECEDCKERLQRIRTANSRFNKVIPYILICPKCFCLFKVKLERVKHN